MVKIFIDPGHGGSDPGATGNGLQEKTLTLQIALALRTILTNEYEGVSLLLSRTSDQFVSLNDRTNAANNWGADFFLSIHVNSGGGTGFESYIYPGVGAPTTTYQSTIHSEVIQAVDFADRGKKTANFHVLRESAMPALLTENGFIDTVADANKLKTSSFIQSLARGHANGLEQAFNLKKTSSSGLYKVQIGAFKVKANADSLASKAEAKGFDSIVLLKDGLYKVQIGAFSSKDNADTLAARAKNAGFDAIVILES
ncbi:sporulation-specific N-acetylmuramoyl-L-alanine amidase [Bacillus subtilis]|uniref:sporulation-specific N-acetylmuramoyl-L-alanine amidase n=1 Tax=Bacillus TaxID=1386 RepID=UPI0002B405CA|nr:MULTISPECIES: sporulation-specific N-acetylmuramoyl-L-alanine amidase [Bacillus]AGE63582.1 N-acetylmuramoyl-L-alanine amidase [Bacillus subtilis XF-1]AGI29042.1 N-acetylmuramoyl-L-alanine amidase [Bacillus subtilis subsp. subtilis str. BAB-1]AKD35149.1 N-acetylmuramoyl-L-alanine amidase [Bacillus subtilis HJ5]ALS82092.1 N-acetylmuramoyl-L-alanine amidase [Bacillus subtilis subsp. subtilis]ASK23816.1 N-acetylmuramoyl-L-alanine amidase [Bacillus subtilis]